MDRLAEFIFKLLLFMTTPWFFLYSYFNKDTNEDKDEEDEIETYTITIGKIVYEFESWEKLVIFVKTYNKEKR